MKMKKRTLHNLSHFKNATSDMGELIPVMCEEALAGDTWKHKTDTFMRLLPTRS